jgi:hypothetical protein
MRIDELKYRVRAKIDELGSNDSDMMDIDRDNKELDVMIEQSAIDGLRYLLLHINLDDIKATKSTGPVVIGADKVGRVTLPDNFLRLKSVRLSSWSRAVSSLVSEDSAYYLMQKDAYACGTPERPVAAIVSEGDKIELELYKANTVTDRMSLYYIPMPTIVTNILGNKEIAMDNVLEEPFVYVVASMVLNSYQEFELSAKMLSTANTLAGIATA